MVIQNLLRDSSSFSWHQPCNNQIAQSVTTLMDFFDFLNYTKAFFERVGGGGVGIVRSCWGKSSVLGQSDSVLSGWVEGFGYAQVFGSGCLVISGVGN